MPNPSFAHVQRLPIASGAIERISELLRDAERFHDASPQVSIYLCRAALEVLCRAVESDRKLADNGLSPPGQAARFESIIADCERDGDWREARLWKAFRSRNGTWNRVTHGEVAATSQHALSELQFWHAHSWRLCFLANPAVGEVAPPYTQPLGIQRELESYRSGEYRSEISARLGKETRLREDAERKYADLQEQLKASEAGIAEARAALEQLRGQVARSDASALQEEMATATARLSELEAARVEVERECEKLREDARRSEVLHLEFTRELGRLREAESSKDEQLARMRIEVDRLRAVQSDKAASEQRARDQAAQAERDLRKALADNDDLRKRHRESPASEQLQSLLAHSERRVRELTERGQVLTHEVDRYRAEREEALTRAADLETQVGRLREEIAVETEERIGLERAEARRRRYDREYPGIERAHHFFDTAIEGDGEGSLPPLSGLINFMDLGVDRYARRLEASHETGSCTVRVIRAHSNVPEAERCRAWGVEQWNLSRIEGLRGRDGIARLVAYSVPDKPGFCAFVRPECSLLADFGRSGKRLRLSSALLFAQAFLEDLVARARERMSVCWPDIHAVGVRMGGAILLEPTAPHFGDLGPPRFIEMNAADCVNLSRDELEAGWTHAVSHALLRVVGAVPVSAPTGAPLKSLGAPSLRLHLEECRRCCDVPIALPSLRQLADILVAATGDTGGVPPTFEELHGAIRAPLTAD